MAAELYRVNQTVPPQAVKITYAWKEAGTVKNHLGTLAAGAVEQKFLVPTGKQIVDEYLRLEVP